jgi:hypothetical protein
MAARAPSVRCSARPAAPLGGHVCKCAARVRNKEPTLPVRRIARLFDNLTAQQTSLLGVAIDTLNDDGNYLALDRALERLRHILRRA